MSKVLIHAGYPKCASTWLQKKVFPRLGNYSNMAFAPRDEKYYPLRDDFDPSEFWRLVEKHTVNRRPDKDHLVISCEDWVELLLKGFEEIFFDFNGLDQERHMFSNALIFNNLKTAFPSADFLLVIRDPLSYVLSRYKMLYRGAKTSRPLDVFLDRPTEGIDGAIERAQNLFGKEQTHVVPFELLKTDADAFLRKIVPLVDPEVQITPDSERVNAAPDLQSNVEYERIKKTIRFRLEKNGRTPAARAAYLLARAWTATVVLPGLRKKYGDRPFTVTAPNGAAEQVAGSIRRSEKLTGLNLKAYGYSTETAAAKNL